MSDIEVSSKCEEGYAVRSRVGDFELSVDASNEEGPTSNQTLVATYASCYVPALRVAAKKERVGELGRVDIDSEADLDEDDDLEAIRFHVYFESELDEDEIDAVVERGKEICHVHSAVREGLHAEVTAEAGAE
jgi:uncharacterized OsmC-like protein